MEERLTKLTTGAGGIRPALLVLATLALALAMALMVRPGVALAAPSPFVDDTTPDFEAGTDDGTQVGDGEVTLAPDVALDEQFDGTEVPADWETNIWNTGGQATVAGGELTVNGAQVRSPATQTFEAGSVLEFAATFREGTFQNAGFATNFNGDPPDSWAAFGESGTAGQLLARVKLPGSNTFLDTPIGTVNQYTGTENVYRIEWASDEIRFYINGDPVHTQTSPITQPMRVAISKFPVGGNNLSVDSVRVFSYPASGQFTSRVFEANGRSDWETLTAETEEPTGTDITFETRSANTAAALQTAAWQPVVPDDTIDSPNGRYLQYRATLTTSDPTTTPALERVEITFEDAQPPRIANNRPTGEIRDRTPKIRATVTDETTDLRKANIRLFVDSRPKTDFSYNRDTNELVYNSPKLSFGRHTVEVRVTDEAGNEATKTWRFRIARPR